MQDLVIVGAGGFAREVAWLVEDCNAQKRDWNLLGYLDDNEEKHGLFLNGYPVLGGLDWLTGRKGAAACIAVGSPATRRLIAQKIGANADAPCLIHPDVRVSRHVTIGKGCILCAGTIVTVNVDIGDFCIVNLDVTIGHDVRMGNFVTIAPGVHVSGNVTIEDNCDIGTGTAIIQGKRIGTNSIVGAGSVVVKDIPANVTAVGVPARPIKTNSDEDFRIRKM